VCVRGYSTLLELVAVAEMLCDALYHLPQQYPEEIGNKLKISEMVQNSESYNILKVLICSPRVLLGIQYGVQYGHHCVYYGSFL